MRRPEKKEDMAKDYHGIIENFCAGYNQSCEDWEKFLPSEEGLAKIIDDAVIQAIKDGSNSIDAVAKAISARLRRKG